MESVSEQQKRGRARGREKKNESERKGESGVSGLKSGMKLLISETICDYFEEKKTHDIALSLKRA